MAELINVVYENSELLVVNKPAGLPCHPAKGDVYSSLITRARIWLGPFAEPRLIHRLDRETSGLVLLAKNKKAAMEVGKIFETRQAHKTYLAVVHGWVAPDTGNVAAPVGRATNSSVRIRDCVRSDGSEAVTTFKVLRRIKRKEGLFTLMKLTPRTGRKHQIRIHLAHIGHPLVGEKLYGGSDELYLALIKGQVSHLDRKFLIIENHALHAYEIRFQWHRVEWNFQAEPSQDFLELLEACH